MVSFKVDANSSHETRGLWASRKAIGYCTIFAIGGSLYGLDYGFNSVTAMVGWLEIYGYKAPGTVLGWNVTTEVQQLFSSLMVVGGLLGSLLQIPMSAFMGRKLVVQIGAVLCAISVAIMLGSTSLAALYVARIIMGIANGIFSTSAQVYIVEILPPNLRGTGIGFFQLWINVSTLISSIVTKYSSTIQNRLCYQIPLIVIMVLPFILFFGVFFTPESPRYLIQHGRYEEAKASLLRLRGRSTTTEQNAEEFGAMLADHQSELARGKEGVRFFDVFRGVDLRRTILSVCAAQLHTATGSQFIIGFGKQNVGRPCKC